MKSEEPDRLVEHSDSFMEYQDSLLEILRLNTQIEQCERIFNKLASRPYSSIRNMRMERFGILYFRLIRERDKANAELSEEWEDLNLRSEEDKSEK